MKFNFQKLGKIQSGSIELGDLTIICGPNNVGKTYVSYAIYGLLQTLQHGIMKIPENVIEKLKSEGTAILDKTLYIDTFQDFLNHNSKLFSNDLSQYFCAPEELFREGYVDCTANNPNSILNKPIHHKTELFKGTTLEIAKDEGDEKVSVFLKTSNISQFPPSLLRSRICTELAYSLYADLFPNPFVVTSERTGIALFYKELDLNKNRILELLATKAALKDEINPLDLIETFMSRYAKPINDNIETIRYLEDSIKKKSFIKNDKTLNKISGHLRDLMGGTCKYQNEQLLYVTARRKNNAVTIPVHAASSSVKSLVLIDLYINHLAQKNEILIIDEPELNLHPDNQREIAGLLVELVNAGVKVLITTHSDYLIREIGDRIMLSNNFPEKDKIQKNFGISSEGIIKASQVKAYCIDRNYNITEALVDKYGINMSIFDDIISASNNQTSRIHFSLEED